MTEKYDERDCGDTSENGVKLKDVSEGVDIEEV